MKVTDLTKEIKDNLSQTSSSRKDEVKVMQAMLNDTSYEVGVYDASGLKETYNPAKDFKTMASSIISSTTKISKDESEKLMSDYEVSKSEASSMVDISKEFVNTYLTTGRKLPFGGRETSSFALSQKHVEKSVKHPPKKVGVNEDGTDRYELGTKVIPEHDSVRVYASCPDWVK